MGRIPKASALRQVAIRGGTRETTASALLHPAMRRSNLTVLTDAQATQVVLKGRRRWAWRPLGARGPDSCAHAEEVIVAAGSIQSPQLLMLSGHRRWGTSRVRRYRRAHITYRAWAGIFTTTWQVRST